MTLDFINVGYGDAILIRSGSFTMLVDCGDWTVGVDHVPKAQIKQAALFKDLAEVLCCFFVNESAECVDSVNEHLIGSPVAF